MRMLVNLIASTLEISAFDTVVEEKKLKKTFHWIYTVEETLRKRKKKRKKLIEEN